MYPDFIGIGAQKAGTTWLSRNLQSHPNIWMPPLKEVHYFDDKIHESRHAGGRLLQRLAGKRVVDTRWRRQVRARIGKHLGSISVKGGSGFSKEKLLWDLRYYAGRPDDEWYRSLFEPGKGRTVGEITPSYSTLGPEVVARAHALAPDAKIILMLRNPMERAWSQAVMQFSKVERRSIGTVGEKRLRRNFESPGSMLRTDYLQTLETWSDFYSEDRIFVGFLEDVGLFPVELLESVYDFLGVDASFRVPGVDCKVHSRSADQVPVNALKYLSEIYRGDAELLSKRFGGYASFWSYCAEKLAEGPKGQGTFPYPLWESSLWSEWLDGKDTDGLQSGTLASFKGR